MTTSESNCPQDSALDIQLSTDDKHLSTEGKQFSTTANENKQLSTYDK